MQINEGGKVEKDTCIEINAAGYINSPRKANDGCVYFGTKETLNALVFVIIY